MLREPALKVPAEDQLSIHHDVKHPARAGDQLRLDANLGLDRRCQTGSLGSEVSFVAVLDADLHGFTPIAKTRLPIIAGQSRTPAGRNGESAASGGPVAAPGPGTTGLAWRPESQCLRFRHFDISTFRRFKGFAPPPRRYNSTMPRPRVMLLANHDRPEIRRVVDEMRREIGRFADIVAEVEANGEPLPDEGEVDMAIAVGGDGTLIAQARRVVDRGLPLVGVNFGRLGFLAEYDVQSLIQHADVVFGDDPPIHEHMMVKAVVLREDRSPKTEGIALNDCVITAGHDFRLIELGLSVDGTQGPGLRGDGVVVATPVGSTAYNVSAGGPIVHPMQEAIIITPLAAYSLAFRPIVLCADSELRIDIHQANEGTTLVLDGQDSVPLQAGQSIVINQYERKVQFVYNPSTSFWGILQDKLNWASPPKYCRREE